MVRTCAAAALLALLLVSGAAADGDPASDVLLAQNTFFPSPEPSAGAEQALNQAVAAAYATSYRVKVAVVASKDDLGAIPSLFGKPADYAKFLGTELQFLYVGPLLIVMPSGFGIYDGGRTTAAEDAVLARLQVNGGSAEDLTRTAATAVQDLLAAGALRSKDILPPSTQVLQTTGRRGGSMRLSYRLYDDSGRASVALAVRRGVSGPVLARFKVPLRAVAFQAVGTVVWKVPRAISPGQLQLCLTATDPSGNRSRKACGAILVT